MVILGPSGAGKSTLLNVISGLIPYSGNVFIDNENIDNLKPAERKVGYVFQDFCLFPHLTVFENVAFGLDAAGVSTHKAKKRVMKILEFLKITSLKDRYPKTLSGGEKQRVALARALVLKPQVMLMDEPLSSVDFSIAKHLRLEFKELQKNLHLTTLYVTHNFDEAKELADRIAVIDNGQLKQVGKAEEVFLNPDPKLQHFIPSPNLLECNEIIEINPGLIKVRCKDITLLVPTEKNEIKKLAILPNDISLSFSKPLGPKINQFKGNILELKEVGPFIKCRVKVFRNILNVEAPKNSIDKENIMIGEKVWVKIKMKNIMVL